MRYEDKKYYFKVLASNECACDRNKKQGKAFCWKCYKSLPFAMQEGLYNRIGQGFEEAYEAAVEYLTVNVW